MSVSHPLLKQLKGKIYDIWKNNNSVIEDNHPHLSPICQTLEEIFIKGLKNSSPTPFGLIKKDYWSWIHQLYEQRETYQLPFTLVDAIESTKNCKKVFTNVGRGRYFIRVALCKKVLPSILQYLMKDEVFMFSMYDPSSSILGNEILCEILSSLMHELSKIDFKLELKNASFLDETWNLGVYKKYEFVPCKEMGITFAYIRGRIVVVKVEEGSVAAEENKIEPGDVLDELFEHSLYRCSRTLISALASKHRGMPIYLHIIKACCPNGKIYPPLKYILDKLSLKAAIETKNEIKDEEDSRKESGMKSNPGSLTFSLLLLGRFHVKNGGRAQHIELAINKALELKLPSKNVVMEITERDVKVFDKDDNSELVNKHFSEISACGRKKACPEIFAFIFGNTTCTIADEFQCYVMEAPSENLVGTILSCVAHGFVKTHWEV